MRRILPLLLLCLLISSSAYAEVSWVSVPSAVEAGKAERYTFLSDEGGVSVLLLDERGGELAVIRQRISAVSGENSFYWDASTGYGYLEAGRYILRAVQGDASADAWISIAADGDVTEELLLEDEASPRFQEAIDTEWHTPAEHGAFVCETVHSYWDTPMGSLDEAEVWAALTSPITVLKGDQRHQIRIRKEPDFACTEYVGEVTGESQGVHVLESSEDGRWTRIGAYSSSVEGSPVRVWADYFEGWVPTVLLQQKEVSQKAGVVIDKLKQRLYVYQDGKLFTTLLCSTGFSKKNTPFNETPAGEFLTISWVGGFWSNNLWCDLGIRINDGILLHEVPVLVTYDENGNEKRDEDRCENYLGDRASHGCIRIQRRQSPEGINMKWLWENLERGKTKVIIWDDRGRSLSYPDDSLTLYYNPNSGRMYHSSPYCMDVNQKHWPLTAFSYDQLGEKPFSKLKPCPACAPQPSHAIVDKLNKDARDF